MGRAISLLALAVATALGFLYFPGHHYLQQDTQIWAPVLTHAQDPSYFKHELIVTGAHIRLTIYDEVTLGLMKLTGASLETVLTAQQLTFRFLALWGVWLLARAVGLSYLASVLAAVVCGMGATIIGPAVLTVEYEPVPRGFAFGLALLAIGLMAQNWYLMSGLALGLAFAYHAPAVWPVLLVSGLVVWRLKKSAQGAHWRALAGFAVFVAVLGVCALMSETGPMNPLFARLTENHVALQQKRATYNWITLWASPKQWLGQYAALALAGILAWWRLGKALPATVRPCLALLPAVGLLSVPLSYVLLEQARLALIPQVQVMRALIYTLMVAVILITLAGLRAASQGRWWEAPWWLAPALFVPMAPVWEGKSWAVYGVAAGLAIAVTLAVSLEKRQPRAAWAVTALALAGCFFAPTGLAKVRNYTTLGDAQLTGLVDWAKSQTGRDDVFLFRDNGQRNEPGMFRARARRAVYVDWKGGGQVNYYEFYANEWWQRWERFMKPPFEPGEVRALREVGVRYLVFRKAPAGWDRQPVFENEGYRVYRLD